MNNLIAASSLYLRTGFLLFFLLVCQSANAQLPACDQLPYIQCDSTYHITSAGEGDYFTQEPEYGNVFFGDEQVFRFKAAYTDELFLTTEDVFNNQEAIVEIKDSLNAHCFDTPGYAVLLPFSLDSIRTISLGQVEAGHTYYLIFDRALTDTLHFRFRLHCPGWCNIPRQLKTGRLGQNTAQLSWQNNPLSNQWELEIRPENMAFTGIPTHAGAGNTTTVNGLTPLTRYHWRVRNICGGSETGAWSAPHGFGTGPVCDGLPDLLCGQPVTLTYQPGPEVLKTCNAANAAGFENSEVYARFTPAYDGFYRATFIPVNWWIQLGVSRTRPDQNCTFPGWHCLGSVGNTGFDQLPMGTLKKDSTYIFAFEFNSWFDYTGQSFLIRVDCPAPCPVPDSLYTANLTHQSVTVGWRPGFNQNQWEVQLIGSGAGTNDTLYFYADVPFLQIDQLQRGKLYRWRVRGLCGALGNSNWSAYRDFITPPDCNLFPPAGCADTLTVPFNAGQGFYQNGPAYTCHSVSGQGVEQVLRFEVSQPGESRFLIVDGAEWKYVWFWRKKAPGQDCTYPLDWKCLGDSLTGQVAQMRNLDSGTYEILIKKAVNPGTDSLRVRFYCELPCAAPSESFSRFESQNDCRPYWNEGTGPWTYEVELRDEQGQASSRTYISSGEKNLLTEFNLSPGNLYEWRVRKVCRNGTFTTDWTEWNRFQTKPECQSGQQIQVWETVPFTGAGQPYVYWDHCPGASRQGSTRLYKFKPLYPGQHFLRITNANGKPVKYILTQEPLCNDNNAGICLTVLTDTLLSIGQPSYTATYALKVQQTDTVLTAQSFAISGPCPKVPQGAGVLHPDGAANLEWTYYFDSDFYIELVALDEPFTGVSNYFSDQPQLAVSGLDPAREYRYRLRPACSDSGTWSEIILLNRVFACSNTPALVCNKPVDVHFGPGEGLIGNPFGNGGSYPGQERYLKIKPPVTGAYQLRIEKISGLAQVQGVVCDGCVGTGQNCHGVTTSGYTQQFYTAGETYTLIFDNANLLGGVYSVELICDSVPLVPLNDNAFSSVPWGDLLALPVAVNAPCQTFSNRYATPDTLDPNPMLAPGNWLDGPEKTVWFHFEAPPGGTVQVTVISDSMNPQVALVRFDSTGFFGYRVLAAGEDSPVSTDATLVYTGLTPGEQYLLMVDGVNGSEGGFCLEVLDAPTLWTPTGVCQTFPQTTIANPSPEDWINLYASAGSHTNGPLLAALQTSDLLGQITISSEIHPTAPVLPNGQKILPRYFNIETEFQPQNPVKLRLFFTEADLAVYNLTPPLDSVTVPQLAITHYDGGNEDCDPNNNTTGATGLPVSNTVYQYAGQDGVFYLETEVAQFSEFGAALDPTSATRQLHPLHDLRVYPTPATDELFLECRAAESAVVQLGIRHLTGCSLWEALWRVTPGVNFRNLKVDFLPPGVYVLSLQAQGGTVATTKIIKM